MSAYDEYQSIANTNNNYHVPFLPQPYDYNEDLRRRYIQFLMQADRALVLNPDWEDDQPGDLGGDDINDEFYLVVDPTLVGGCSDPNWEDDQTGDNLGTARKDDKCAELIISNIYTTPGPMVRTYLPSLKITNRSYSRAIFIPDKSQIPRKNENTPKKIPTNIPVGLN